MATINDLQFRTIKRILAIILFEEAGDLRTWKGKLPYIGVCQSWRYFGLNFVYDRVFFIDYNIYLSKDKSLRQRRGQYFYQRGISNKRPILASNIELFTMMNRCDMVWDMYICANSDGPQNMFLDKLLRLFKQTNGDWFRLQNLFLYQTSISSNDFLDYYPLDYKDIPYDLRPIVEYAKSHFTAIVDIYGSDSNTLIGALTKQLCFSLADKSLTMIANMSQIASSFKHMPQNIAYMDITFNKTNEILHLPFIYAESLYDLKLKNLPPRFDWTCFRNSTIIRGGKIVFQKMYNLTVNYDFDYADKGLIYDRPEPFRGFDIKFSFPCLKYLTLRYCSTNNVLLHSEFPNEATLVRYVGSISSIALCQQIKIRSKALRMFVTSADKQQNSIFYELTNGIFTESNRETVIEFFLESIFFPINVDLVEWEYLSRLSIGIPITFKLFLTLLQKLTRLNILHLKTDSIEAIQRTFDYILVDILDNTPDFILSRNLEYIEFQGEYDTYKHQEIHDFGILLITKCPKLKRISMPNIFKDEIKYSLNDSSTKVPSINNLNIEYRTYPMRHYFDYSFYASSRIHLLEFNR